MKEKLEARLSDLKGEFEKGEQALTQVEARKIQLEQTLLRLSGAIQVLEEELGVRDAEGAEPRRKGARSLNGSVA